MKHLLNLYARYDGPIPRRRNFRTDGHYLEEMLRAQLFTIRLRRCRSELRALAPLVQRAKKLREKLKNTNEQKELDFFTF